MTHPALVLALLVSRPWHRMLTPIVVIHQLLRDPVDSSLMDLIGNDGRLGDMTSLSILLLLIRLVLDVSVLVDDVSGFV
jgi:hypothetical protein